MQLLRALLYIGVNRNLWSFRLSSGPGKAPLVRMHRFFFAIIIESALSPIQKRKKRKRAGGALLANPNSHTSRPRPDRQTQHQNRFPRAHATVLARLLAGRGVRFSCSLQMRTYVSWAGSSDRETIFRRFYRTESLSYPEPCSRNRRYIRFLKFSSYSS
jgi:hypothetical protein